MPTEIDDSSAIMEDSSPAIEENDQIIDQYEADAGIV